MTTSLWNVFLHSAATLHTCTTASGSSAFTWKMGAETTCHGQEVGKREGYFDDGTCVNWVIGLICNDISRMCRLDVIVQYVS